MRNFLQIAEQVDVMPLRLALQGHADLWNVYPFRTHHAESPHREADDILLRCQPPDAVDKRECSWYPAAAVLPEALPHIYWLMGRTLGLRLGRVIITRLAPGAQIFPHADVGQHPLHYDTEPYYTRFHVLLACPPKAVFACGDEEVWMPTGTVWTFDNTQEHAVYNGGTSDRLTLIVDIHRGGHTWAG